MGFQKRKGDFLLAFVLMILLMKTNSCIAALLVKSNTTYQCNGRVEECRIAEDVELKFGLVMNSNVIRILQGGSNPPVTAGTGNPSQPVQRDCPSSYSNCIANGGQPNCRNLYSCGRQQQG